jgi:hypothetical protein
VVLGFLNYRKKVGGIGPVFLPTGDIHADMQQIRAFYSGIHGKHPVQEIFVMAPSNPLLTAVELLSLQSMDTGG